MDTNAKIAEIIEKAAEKINKMRATINTRTNSYDFEKSFKESMVELEQSLYQAIVGEDTINKNDRVQLMTSFGEIKLRKDHPLSVSPGGFRISAYLQEQMCRLGTKMTFEEASEELNKLLSIDVNAKQIERLCHHYGEQLEQINWREAYSDGVQLRIPFNKQLYILMDGSMLLTRDKEQAWKEVKLCRMFYNTDRIDSILPLQIYLCKVIMYS